MELLSDIFLDTLLDCLKMLPFLLAAFLLIEILEHYSGNIVGKVFRKIGRKGPVVGALAGCMPQCGFSVMAANLYAGGVISLGTLMAVFLATSDEAVLIILSDPDRIGEVGILLAVKILTAVFAGYFIDVFLKNRIETGKRCERVCEHCGCHEKAAGIFLPALRHTRKIFLYLLVFTWVLNFCVRLLGMDILSSILLGNTIFQPVIAAVIGFIPNCASSVILIQLYLNGAISFAAVIAGLCTGTGVGLAVLCKVNCHKKENVKIAGLLFIFAVMAGIILGTMEKFIGF
ncbi:MAG: arsenic efflux protein [Dorea sp.]|jgi:hypothetical protein|nr:arsenic efflux protein [Dorea sp.]